MTGRLSWRLAAASALVLLTASSTGMALAMLSSPRPFGSATVGFTYAYDREALEILTEQKTPAGLALAAAQARRALALSPYNNAARLRLAYIDTRRREGRLGPVGLGYLSQSYDLAPIDHTVAAWRVGFALEHWEELTPEIRAAAHTEAMAFARVGSQDANVRAALESVHDPEGRIAAALWLRALHR